MLKHQDIELTLEDINHLVVTLENLGVNCDDEARLLDFIIDLIDQMDVTGIDLYRRNIQIVTEDIEIESAFIQSNVSGIGFNALYYLSDQHSRIMALISDDELCNSDAAREKIISRIFGDEFDGLATTYTLRDLVAEIVGGGLLAIAIYRDINGLDVQADVFPPLKSSKSRSRWFPGYRTSSSTASLMQPRTPTSGALTSSCCRSVCRMLRSADDSAATS